MGEGLQARPVLERLRAERPDLQLAYTYFSPSAVAFASRLDVDFRDFLPFDTWTDARVALAALEPAALVFSKVDVWPVLAAAAQERGTRLALISATLPAGSRRLRGLAPALLHDAYHRLDSVGAVALDDADRLQTLGCRPAAIEVTGDTRFDQVWDRAIVPRHGDDALAPLRRETPTLVAGSTWPSDEQHLLPAFLRARDAAPMLRLIIAPHEPTRAQLAPIDSWAAAAGLRSARLDEPHAPDADVIIVDRVGVLGDLYGIGDIAFVGGGFHRAGLHSVLEPAAFGVPVIFGPRHHNSREASLLLNEGAAASPADGAALTAVLRDWLGDRTAREAAGTRARDLVARNLGATTRTADLIQRLLPV